MPADVSNAFDIAFWFADTALNENEYLQPQKLQRLLFIAQSYYCIVQKGRKLMPAVFVADETRANGTKCLHGFLSRTPGH